MTQGIWTFDAYQRQDGGKGIRNVVAIVYLVECAHHVARAIAARFADQDVHVIGFPGCYPNEYAFRMLQKLCTHPNVGAALMVSLGCEGFNRFGLAETVRRTGRPVETVVIQDSGGTRRTIDEGAAWVAATLRDFAETPRVAATVSDLVVGTICGGSDATSGLTANPAMGRAFDLLIAAGGAGIFEETGELLGCEGYMAERAATPDLAREILRCMEKTAAYYRTMGYPSFSPGNEEGGLTTIEEKSLGAYAKSGRGRISGLLKPGDAPPASGLYLLDVIPDGEPRYGFPNINDNAEIAELIACGAQVILFSTGRGSVVGSAIAPVIKVCANPDTYQRMADDMDVDAGRILNGAATLDEVGEEVFDRIKDVVAGAQTCSESLGHQEFILTYKHFEPIGPACLPLAS